MKPETKADGTANALPAFPGLLGRGLIEATCWRS